MVKSDIDRNNMKDSQQHQYFEFLRCLLNQEPFTSSCLADMDWNGFARFVSEQSIVGVVFDGLNRLDKKEVKPPLMLLLRWTAMAEQIEGRNRDVNITAANLCRLLREDGFDCCILKGQGNNLVYPNVYSRMSGDIDVWVKPHGTLGTTMSNKGKSDNLDIRKVIRYVKGHNPEARAVYHHIDYGDFNGTEVEVHYRPSFMSAPIHNHRLLKWFESQAAEQFAHGVELPDGAGEICIPTLEFNLVYQLSHIYNHVLHEGIGLRQVIDYFYLLKSSDGRWEKTDVAETLRYLGLWGIAGAMMWVLHEILGLEERYLFVPMNEKLGKVFLAEMIRGGNFGKYDKDNLRADNQLKKNLQRLKRDVRMLRYFPSECLWEPVFRLYHFFWRVKFN